jgi:hypothetical protein
MIPTINTLVATKPKQHQNNVVDILNSQTNPTLGLNSATPCNVSH